MKNLLRELYIRILIKIGYLLGLWGNISSAKKFLKNKNVKSEYLYLKETCYYTELDEKYLKISVKNRVCGSIFNILEKNNYNYYYTSDPEKIKQMIEDCFNIKINTTNIGYSYTNTNNGKKSDSFWYMDSQKEYKRLMELLSVCITYWC